MQAVSVMTTVTDADPILGNRKFKYSALNTAKLERGAIFGDSGALVAGNGVDQRHVYGIAEAINSLDQSIVYFFASNDVKTAFANAGFSFSYFWGTASGYWRPATTQTDP